MNMPVHIFLGPTLPAEEAARICPAQYHPPVRMGDVFALLPERPRIIGIVDGLFHCTPAVWHKEILAALSQGVIVVGAASMGALRAAELAQLGMVGVGRVFEQLAADPAGELAVLGDEFTSELPDAGLAVEQALPRRIEIDAERGGGGHGRHHHAGKVTSQRGVLAERRGHTSLPSATLAAMAAAASGFSSSSFWM